RANPQAARSTPMATIPPITSWRSRDPPRPWAPITDFNGQSIVYDANGNLIDDGDRAYQWDAENRLLSVVSKSQPDRAVTFRYDGLGRRIAIESASGVETRYLWCGNVLCQARDLSDLVS